MGVKISSVGILFLATIILPCDGASLTLPPTLGCGRPTFDEAIYDGHIKGRIPPNRKLQVKCKDNYKDVTTYVTCLETGKWSRPTPECQLVTCPDPTFPGIGSVKTDCRLYRCTATYSCPEGYLHTGTRLRTCQRNETWSGLEGNCEAVQCPAVADPLHGKVHQPDRSYMTTLSVICDEGYVYRGPGPNRRQCQADNSWSGTRGFCKAVQCPSLPSPENGIILQDNRSYLANATVRCHDGYKHSDPEFAIRQCSGNNTWSGQDTLCKKISCPDILNLVNGILTANEGKFRDEVSLQCRGGHVLDGPGTITCQADGTWTPELGVCRTRSIDMLPLLVLIPFFVLLLTGVCCCWYLNKRTSVCRFGGMSFHSRSNMLGSNLLPPESIPLMVPTESIKSYHCSFTLTRGKELSLEMGSPDVIELSGNIENAIKKTLQIELDGTPYVKVVQLCPMNNAVFIDIYCKDTSSEGLIRGILQEKVKFQTERGAHAIVSGSVMFRGRPEHYIVADIHKKRHIPDKVLDKAIDFEKNYVKLKLLSTKEMKAMQRGDMERPDLYQRELGKLEGEDVQDEDLVKSEDIHKYVLVRGRAGIGKSTLLQRLCWKWANCEWATQFKVIFMINLRYLMNIERKMPLSRLLSLYTVYNTGDPNIIIEDKWLLENEANIGIILDGIDEVQNFKQHWLSEREQRDLSSDDAPLHWCFGLMKRTVLSKATVIVSSRPFVDLNFLQENLIENHQSAQFKLVELMGLTRERVIEFVDRNTIELRREFVKDTLEKNPLLFSVCAITFYCAALCKVLGEEDVRMNNLTTYTRITYYIMKMYMQRSMTNTTYEEANNEKMSATLRFLSNLASIGLLEHGRGGVPRLVFDQNDINKLSCRESGVEGIAESGLLMQTRIPNPERPEEMQILNQFVHLSIQEFLAMQGLLQEHPGKVKKVLQQLSRTGQFNMALLFLFGLAFDKRKSSFRHMPDSSRKLPSAKKDLTKLLLDNIGCISSNLQALQIAHESQSKQVALKIGQERFKKEVSISGTKLTALDVIAMIFMLEHHPSADTIRLRQAGVDSTSIQELSRFLTDTDTINRLELNDNNFDDDCFIELVGAMKLNTSIRTLILTSTSVTDSAMAEAATMLKMNNTLTYINLTFGGVSDRALGDIAEGLMSNTSVQELSYEAKEIGDSSVLAIAGVLEEKRIATLSLTCDEISDIGIEGIAAAIKIGTSLDTLRLFCDTMSDRAVKTLAEVASPDSSLHKIELLGFYMEEEGTQAVIDAIETNKDLTVGMWHPECTDDQLDQLETHSQVIWLDQAPET